MIFSRRMKAPMVGALAAATLLTGTLSACSSSSSSATNTAATSGAKLTGVAANELYRQLMDDA